MHHRPSLLVLVCCAALLPGSPPFLQEEPGLPEEFRQLLPRGGIPAIDDPQFVPAKEAEIPGDAWVLGLVLGGQARAYSLNILNHHEVVNDRIGGPPSGDRSPTRPSCTAASTRARPSGSSPPEG